MTDFHPAEPIKVNASAAQSIAASNFRVILIAFGSYAVGKGWFTQSEWTELVPLAMIVLPWAWGQIQNLITHRKLVLTAEAAPNSVATVN